MATLRDLRKRLKAVKNTEKITKAMKMVAASKLRRAQNAILRARPYALRMNDVLQHIVSRADLQSHPLLAYRKPHRVELVILTSNRGLCGSFNSNIIRAAERFLAENKSKYDEIRVATIGKKGRDHFQRKGVKLYGTYEGVLDKLEFEKAVEIASDLSTRFRNGELDAVFLLYNEFKSAIAQKVVVTELLPLTPLAGWEENPAVRVGELAAISGNQAAVAGRESGISVDQIAEPEAQWTPSEVLEVQHEGYEHLFEPSREAVLDTLLPQHLAVQIWRALLESTAAEHGARMSAMDAASRNAKEMIGKLTLNMNRVRQASITKELMEIVSGAEALK
ncbi:ATP synthase F1 subunit gamma [Myxococcota bacterium]|nr:ATP synthase F1 subunit gamma [Myxococcota bacterium]